MANYTIQSGDNLTKIAKAHNTTVQDLARINNISDPNKIQAGKVIKLFEEKAEPQDFAQANNQRELAQQLEDMQSQLDQMQNYMRIEPNNNPDAWDMLGLGLGTYGAYKLGEKALPYAWKSAKSATKATCNVGKAAGKSVANATTDAAKFVASGTRNIADKIGAQAKHIAKKVELEYAFGKDAVKQGVKKAANTTATVAKTTVSKSGKILALTKAGKAVSKRLPGVGIAVAAVETYEAGKDGGAKAAVKQGVKSASGLACGAAGAKIGAIAGACTGPAAVVAVPVLTVVGGVVGYIGGEKLIDKITSWFE